MSRGRVSGRERAGSKKDAAARLADLQGHLVELVEERGPSFLLGFSIHCSFDFTTHRMRSYREYQQFAGTRRTDRPGQDERLRVALFRGLRFTIESGLVHLDTATTY